MSTKMIETTNWYEDINLILELLVYYFKNIFYNNKNEYNSSSRLNYGKNQSCTRLLNPSFV
jgi:hypothetical protein